MNESSNNNINPKQLNNLWKAIGWRTRKASKWKDALTKSSYVYSLWEAQKLVGLGRIMEDGTMCMLYDIAIHPDYQKKGLGTKIMKKLISQIQTKGYVSIGLFAWEKNPENIKFYEKLGFERSAEMELRKLMKKE